MKRIMVNMRLLPSDKRLLSRLARSERRTMSNFLVNLIHERQALANRMYLDGQTVPRGPLPRRRCNADDGAANGAEEATQGKAVGE